MLSLLWIVYNHLWKPPFHDTFIAAMNSSRLRAFFATFWLRRPAVIYTQSTALFMVSPLRKV